MHYFDAFQKFLLLKTRFLIHPQKFGEDGVASVVRNVFDFDSWSGEAKETVMKVMHKYGIPVGASTSNVVLAKRYLTFRTILFSCFVSRWFWEAVTHT